jgi:hypothetical protein
MRLTGLLSWLREGLKSFIGLGLPTPGCHSISNIVGHFRHASYVLRPLF